MVLAIVALAGSAVADDKPPLLTVPPIEDKQDTRPFLDRAADFLGRTKQRLKELDAKARSEAVKRRIEADAALKKAKEELREAEAEYERLKKATKESAGDVNEGVKDALSRLSNAYRDAKTRFDQAEKDTVK